MEHRFHLFVRRHRDVGYTVSVITHPFLATFADDVDEARADLARVAARLLARDDKGIADEVTHWPDLRLRRIDLAIRAVQHKRLLSVPMRFTVLTHSTSAEELPRARKGVARDLTVRIPRLGYCGELGDLADLEAYVEEVVRDELYMAPLERLLAIAYDGEESVETLTVQYKPRAPRAAKKSTTKSKRESAPAALSEASRRLNDEYDAGTLDRAFQRDAVVTQLSAMLGATKRASVVLVGASGAGKTAVVHELVHRLEEGNEPLEVYSTSASRIVAGMRYLGEWQARVQRMIDALRVRRAVLHIESLAELLSTGGASTGMDVAGYLVPVIETGEIGVIVEASPEDLSRAERTHPALVQALRPLHLAPLPAESAVLALRSVATRIGRTRKVRFTDDGLLRALDLTERFGDGAALPGSAIQLLRAAAQRDVTPADTAPTASTARTVDAAAITRAFTARTGYPAELVDPSIPLDADAVFARLTARVVGQDAALALLRDLVVTLKTGLADPSRPLGSFLLLGPTGVGKTESALALAEFLFGDPKRMARFDMSEYAAPGSALRLVNDWGGREGALAQRVREQPFGIVLFDEIEKADGSVHDLLLQILGEGRLTDATGRVVSFRNTIVMLTSNLGAETAGRSLGFGTALARDAGAHYTAAAAAFFRPELLNRFDHIVPYRPLGQSTIETITRRALARVLEREGLARRGVSVQYDDAVVTRLAAIGFDARYGARPLQRAIEHWVVAPLARVLAARPERGTRRLELVVRGDAVAVAPTSRPEVTALDDASLGEELARAAARDARSTCALSVIGIGTHSHRAAEWLAGRYRAFCERHSGSCAVALRDGGDGYTVSVSGAVACLLRHEAGTHEFALEGLDVRLTVTADDAVAPDVVRYYARLPVPSVLDGATDYELVQSWDDALSGAWFDRIVLARAVGSEA